jgi:hypothetical protein
MFGRVTEWSPSVPAVIGIIDKQTNRRQAQVVERSNPWGNHETTDGYRWTQMRLEFFGKNPV